MSSDYVTSLVQELNVPQFQLFSRYTDGEYNTSGIGNVFFVFLLLLCIPEYVFHNSLPGPVQIAAVH